MEFLGKSIKQRTHLHQRKSFWRKRGETFVLEFLKRGLGFLMSCLKCKLHEDEKIPQELMYPIYKQDRTKRLTSKQKFSFQT